MRRALAILALAVSGARMGAQATTPPDTLPPPPRRDSVFAPLPLSEGVPADRAGNLWRWSRDQLSQTGALSLADLLERIPGARVLRSGFLLAPQVVTWWGDPGRVRLFLDGVELDALDQRAGAARDLGLVELWTLESVEVEATPSELRVHLRSWRVDRRFPETRVDVYTGNDDTNLYRGYYGRRFASGLGAQFGFQQQSTVNRALGGDGDGISLFGRLGWSRGDWSTDLAAFREGRTRNETRAQEGAARLAGFTGAQSRVLARVAYRTPEGRAPWLQLTAQTGRWAADSTVDADSVPALREASREQLVLAGGATLFGLRVSNSWRYRLVGDDWYLSPEVRLGTRRFGLDWRARLEYQAEDSIRRADVSARYAWRFLSAEVGASQRAPMWTNAEASSTTLHGLVTATYRGWSVGGGLHQRPEASLLLPRSFGPDSGLPLAARQAQVLRVEGPIWRAIRLEAHRTQWDDLGGAFRPQEDLRIRVHGETEWRSRFPRGDFTVRAAVEYHRFGDWDYPGVAAPTRMVGAAVWGSNLEIRIRTATISWQFRNLTGAPYQTVPGFLMPQRVNLYGVRWYFSD